MEHGEKSNINMLRETTIRSRKNTKSIKTKLLHQSCTHSWKEKQVGCCKKFVCRTCGKMWMDKEPPAKIFRYVGLFVPNMYVGIEGQFPRKYPSRIRPGILTTDGIMGGVSVAGGATPWWQWDFEDNQTCTSTGKFDSSNVAISCQDTTSGKHLGSYGMKIVASDDHYNTKNLDAAQSEVWIQFYFNAATLTSASWKIVFLFGSVARQGWFGVDTTNWNLRVDGNSSGDYSGGAVSTGVSYFRLHFRISATTGIFRVARSTSEDSGYTTIATTPANIDTSAGGTFLNVSFGHDTQASADDRFYDNIKIYHTDPGWTF